MTQHWNDIDHTDCIVVIGGNPAENHPIAFNHMTKAMNDPQCGCPSGGAKLISVDPRFTRTSSKADIYAPMRSGTDIAFINGLMRHIIFTEGPSDGTSAGYNDAYVRHYTNVPFLLRGDFEGVTDVGHPGLFSGFTPGAAWQGGTYNKDTWAYAKFTDADVAGPGTAWSAGIVVTGFGTKWKSMLRPGDKIRIPASGSVNLYDIATVNSDTQLTVTAAMGNSGGPVPYWVQSGRAHTAFDLMHCGFDASGNCICGCGNYTNYTGAGGVSCDGTVAGRPKSLQVFKEHLRDDTDAFVLLDNPGNSVWEELKPHMNRYTLAKVEDITGCPQAKLLAVYNEYTKTGADGKAGTIMYAMGTTQHSHGTQNIRAYAMTQLLLGNTGVRGGGVNAMRGESNVQGSTDHCLLEHILPGYLKQPLSTTAGDKDYDRTNEDGGSPGYPGATIKGDGTEGHPDQPASYIKGHTPFTLHPGELNWWGYWPTPFPNGQSNAKRYVSSLMKCYWWDALGDPTSGDTASDTQLQTTYDWIPKKKGDCTHIAMFERMFKGNMKGMFCFGQNPSVGGPNSKIERRALRKLDWLVVADLWETETAAFWQWNVQGGKPLSDAAKANIDTEVFLLPAAAFCEKEGSITNSSRWMQWRYKAADPPGSARHEIWVLNALFDKIKAEFASRGPVPPQIANLTMGNAWYGTTDPSAMDLAVEINGVYANDPSNRVGSFTALQDDGTTASGNWLYTNSVVNIGADAIADAQAVALGRPDLKGNKGIKRDNSPNGIGGRPSNTYANWSWCWPVNRRVIYNGASLIPNDDGSVSANSWDTTHQLLWYNGGWEGDKNDAVAGPGTYRGVFVMKNDGHGHIFGPGRLDGPFPEHYEPLENPYGMPASDGTGPNPMNDHTQLFNPVSKVWRPAQIGDLARYPIIGTTYRVSEHWQAGAQTRNLPWLVELMPNVFVEMSEELAALKGITTGDKIKVMSKRGNIHAYAVVTKRFKPFDLDIGTRHEIGVIWHFGYKGLAQGHSGNILTPHVGCANTTIPEYKAFRCQVALV